MDLARELAPLVILAALVGWCLGFLSAFLTDWLQAQDELPSAAHGRLVRDVAVQVGSALVWAAAPLLIDGVWWRWVAAAVIAVPLVQVAVTDFRHRYVYTIVAAIGAALGLGLGWLVHGYDWWWGAIGAAGGLLSFLVVYGIGRLMYRGEEPLARGDVTIAAMVGAGAGTCTLNALVLGILFSGLFAIGVLVLRRSRHAMLPYGPGLCLGALVTLFRC
jgi:prepilin signal peptidase PulO-like enzyme (type II secretory pathway)